MNHKNMTLRVSIHQWNKKLAYAFTLFFCCLLPTISQAQTLPVPKKITSFKNIKSIPQFIHYVWQTNPAIQSADSNVMRADAEFSQSRQAVYNPDLSFEAQHIAKNPDENTYTAGISQTIDLSNKRNARSQVGQYGFSEAKANLTEQKLVLAAETLEALAEYRAEESAVKLATRRTDLLRKFKVLNARRLKSGDIAQDAADLASLAYAEAVSQQAEEEVKLTRARQKLLQITHIPVRYWPRLESQLPKPLDPPDSQQKAWLDNLPIIQLYNARVSEAVANISVAKARTKIDPTLSLSAGEEDSAL